MNKHFIRRPMRSEGVEKSSEKEYMAAKNKSIRKKQKIIQKTRSGSPIIREASPASLSRRGGVVSGGGLEKKEGGEPRGINQLMTSPKERPGARKIPIGYVMVMILLLTAMTVTLVVYTKLHADITDTIEQISTLENELTDLKSANDETYNEIVNSIDLDEIRDKAINDLGMQYADPDQVVNYSDSADDYVHQVTGVDDSN